MAQPSAPGELPRDAGRGLRIGIVVSRFNEALCKRLLESWVLEQVRTIGCDRKSNLKETG